MELEVSEEPIVESTTSNGETEEMPINDQQPTNKPRSSSMEMNET